MRNSLYNSSLFVVVTIFLSALFFQSALADDYDDGDQHGRRGHKHERENEDSNATYAEVVNVKPIVEEVKITTPHRECHEEEVTEGGNDGRGGAVVGAVAGGALGNAAGHNTQSRRLDTVVGVIGGAIIGKKMSESDGTTGTETVCHRRNSVDYEDKTVGYDVTYRYFGHEYSTRMDHDPGDRIKVAVDVRPAE